MTKLGNFAFGGDQRSYSFAYFHADMIPNSLTVVQCPNMPCEQVFIQNDPDSTGDILIGSDRLAAVGSGFRLAPGDATGWIPIQNLNLVWHKDEANSRLKYMIIR